MAQGPTYKKYGGFAAPDMKSMVAGQQAVGDSLQDAFGGVEKLMQDTEERYREKNTLNMQEYLKGSIKNAGLGADPVDTIGIKKKFGDLINMDQVNKTVAGTREEMANEARDEASGAAGTTFSQTESLSESRKAYENHLRDLNMPEADVQKEGRQWSNENKYLVEEVELNNKKTIRNAVEKMAAMKRNNPDMPIEEIETAVLDGVPKKLRTPATLKMRDTYRDLGKRSEDALAEYDHISRVTQNQIDLSNQQNSHKIAAAKAELDAAEYLPAIAYEGGSDWGKVMAEEADGQIFEWGRLEEEEVPRAVQGHIESLIKDDNIPPDDAFAIGYQAYQDTVNEAGRGFTGVALPPDVLKRKFDNYRLGHKNKSKKLANYNQIQEDALKEQTRLVNNRENLLYGVQKGQKNARRTGNSYNSETQLRNSIFGSGPEKQKSGGGSDKDTNKNENEAGSSGTEGSTLLSSEVEKIVEEAKKGGGSGEPKPTGNGASASWADPKQTGQSGKPSTAENEAKLRRNGMPIMLNGKAVTADQRAQANNEVMGSLVTGPAKFANNGLNQIANAIMEPGREVVGALDSFQSWGRSGGFNKYPEKEATKVPTPSTDKVDEVSPVIMDSLSKMPSTDASAQEMADRLRKTQGREEWARVIGIFEKANPELARKLKKLLKVG